MFTTDLPKGRRCEEFVFWHISQKYTNALLKDGYFPDFDIEVPSVFTVECKYDEMSRLTKNIAVEFQHNGKWSGIASTKADYWVHMFYDENWKWLAIPVKELQQLCKAKGSKKYGGDYNTTAMFLIPKTDLPAKYVRSCMALLSQFDGLTTSS